MFFCSKRRVIPSSPRTIVYWLLLSLKSRSLSCKVSWGEEGVTIPTHTCSKNETCIKNEKVWSKNTSQLIRALLYKEDVTPFLRLENGKKWRR